MKLSSVRIVPTPGGHERGCIATASMLIDDCVRVRSMRVIRRRDGKGLLLAFPNTELRQECARCRTPCGITDRHCRMCGARLPAAAAPSAIHIDVVYPTTAAAREAIENAVFGAPDMARIARGQAQ